MPATVAHAFNPCTDEAEVGGSLRVETLSKERCGGEKQRYKESGGGGGRQV